MSIEGPEFEQPQTPEQAREKMLKMIEESSVLSPSKKLDLATFLLYDKKRVACLGDHKIIEPEDNEEALRKEFSEEIEEIKKVLKDMHQTGKVVAAICHGGWMLVSADILRGKKATSLSAIQDDMKNAGAEYINKEVVRDGNIITSRQPDDLPAFCRTIIEALV